jgi:hypothetical protein
VFSYSVIGLATGNAALVKDYPSLLGAMIVPGALTMVAISSRISPTPRLTRGCASQ